MTAEGKGHSDSLIDYFHQLSLLQARKPASPTSYKKNPIITANTNG